MFFFHFWFGDSAYFVCSAIVLPLRKEITLNFFLLLKT